MSELICSKCGSDLIPSNMRGEESLIRLADRKILAANRWFDADCPQCGPVFQNKVGHHATIQSKQLKELFPKSKLRALKTALSDNEFCRLKAARAGKASLTEEELGRFSRMVKFSEFKG